MRLRQVGAGQPIRGIAQPVRVSAGLVILGWLARHLTRLLWLIVTTPTALASITVVVGLVWLYRAAGWWPIVLLMAVLGAGLVWWWWRWPATYLRWVREPVR